MTSFSVWGTTLVAITVAGAALAGCGETSNFVGNMPENAGSGGTTSNAGSSSGGTTSHAGTTSGGTSSAGTTSVAGTGSGGTAQGGTGAGGTTHGGTGTGGTDPGNCTKLSGNWTSCDQGHGVVHRTAPGKCESKLPGAGSLDPIDPQLDECTKDSECTAKPNGFCAAAYADFTQNKPHNYCDYGCTQDADCSQGQICQCGAEIGACVSARDCKSDQDCQGGLCAQYDACPGVPSYDFACQKPNDQCTSNAQCQQSDPNKQFCAVTGNDSHRECVGVQCQI